VEVRSVHIESCQAHAGDGKGIALAQSASQTRSFDGYASNPAGFFQTDQRSCLFNNAGEHRFILADGDWSLFPRLCCILAGGNHDVSGDKTRDILLSIVVTATARVCVARDRLLRRFRWDGRIETAGPGTSLHAIQSGRNALDAVLVRPQTAPQASLLICHGIGETVELWHRVQQLLAQNGVASLVFDYSGYGRSTGFFSSTQAEQDAVAAFHVLEQLTTPLPVSILGLSLGSGIAAASIKNLPAHRLVLCSAFTSLRKAAISARIPKMFSVGVPPIWDAEEALRECRIPVLIVHGEKDRLFPVRMARELARFCNSPVELAIIPNATHNDPFYHPQQSYWGEIIARFLKRD
jgi:pimeloyl-ACP methyl ester carboxylesterase